MRRKLAAANWKMNLTPVQEEGLATVLRESLSSVQGADVLLCPSYLSIEGVRKILTDTKLLVGAQDLHWEPQGARTGKVSADMLQSIGIHHVILGHSEQRKYFHETDETVNLKVQASWKHEITPIICVGEDGSQREQGWEEVEKVITKQISSAYQSVSENNASRSIIAYEPVWAIGTGKAAGPEQAEEVHCLIRRVYSDQYGEESSKKVRILYGGSINENNSKELFSCPNIDGGLIGGASLKEEDFTVIAHTLAHSP